MLKSDLAVGDTPVCDAIHECLVGIHYLSPSISDLMKDMRIQLKPEHVNAYILEREKYWSCVELKVEGWGKPSAEWEGIPIFAGPINALFIDGMRGVCVPKTELTSYTVWDVTDSFRGRWFPIQIKEK